MTNETVRCTRGALAAWQGEETTNVVSRFYDTFGRNAGYAHNGIRQSTLAYDPVTGRLASMQIQSEQSNNPNNQTIKQFTWNYLAGSDLKSSLAYPNGLAASWQYDANNQLLQVRNAFPTNTISQYDYAYDAGGRRVQITRSGSAMSANRADVYGYNARGELISASKLGGQAAVPATTEYAYEYDDIGNRITSFDLGTNRTYIANCLNQYTQISNLCDSASLREEFIPQFDDDGNQTLIQTATGVWQVQYNGENRPILWSRVQSNNQTIILMAFDRMGRRVHYLETCGSVTNSNKVFTYDGYLQVANFELSTSNIKHQTFMWDPTEPVATRPLVFYGCVPAPQFYTHDGNKNVSELVSSIDASTVTHYEYGPFGEPSSQVGECSFQNPFRFSCEYFDGVLDIVYYNYRHYTHYYGCWMNRDPFEYSDDFNRYNMCKNALIRKVDVLGLWSSLVIETHQHMVRKAAQDFDYSNASCLGDRIVKEAIVQMIINGNVKMDRKGGLGAATADALPLHYNRTMGQDAKKAIGLYKDGIKGRRDEINDALSKQSLTKRECVDILSKLGELTHMLQDYYGHGVSWNYEVRDIVGRQRPDGSYEISTVESGCVGPSSGNPDNPLMKPSIYAGLAGTSEHGPIWWREPGYRAPDTDMRYTLSVIDTYLEMQKVLPKWCDKCCEEIKAIKAAALGTYAGYMAPGMYK